MAPSGRRHGGIRSALRESPRRKGNGREDSKKSPAVDRYGLRRLGALYEISKLLGQFSETPEATVLAFLAILTKELPLRSAILIEKLSDQAKTVIWHAPDISPAGLRASEARAASSFKVLTQSAAPRDRADAGAKSDPAERGRFITIPLIIHGHAIFGALHLEGVSLFDESDVAFASAIANQLAVALDRNQARLNEIALRKRAEELNEFKTDLVSVVSHEFGNSLTVMKIAAGLLEKKLPPKWLQESDQLFAMILNNIDLLNRAVQNLLNMGRVEAGKLAIDFKPTDAAEVLATVLKSLELLCEQKKIRATLALPDDLRPVRADPSSLTLVISNLLSNAIKYTPENGRIVLGLLREGSRPGYYRVFVQDTGVGVSEEDRAKILGGHFRSESGKKMTAKGFGVGLSLAQQIVEAHGSTIEIEGGPGKGSRFSFLLPLAGENEDPSPGL